MNKIKDKVDFLKKQGRVGLMTHAVIGYPSLADSYDLVYGMVDAGVDFLELQIPFSDPTADGSVIMKANDIALGEGVTVEKCFAFVKNLREKISVPVILMGYYNSVYYCGVKQFCRQAVSCGVDGLIIPDIPPDEEKNEGYLREMKKSGLCSIRVLSPTSSIERIVINAKVGSGFIYCTAYSGITGGMVSKSTLLKNYVQRVREHTKLPVAVGFGIKTREQIQELSGLADIAVVGSAIVQKIAEGGISSARDFVKSLVV